MSAFPLDVSSRSAMIRIIDETFPQLGVATQSVAFDEPYFSPTIADPGRTFVAMEILDLNQWYQFRYTRIDLAVIGEQVGEFDIPVEGDITPRKIIEALNAALGLQLNSDDVNMSDGVVAPEGLTIKYRVRAKPGSLVWYGSHVVRVTPDNIPENARLMEDGSIRTLETGDSRLLEMA